MNDQSFNNWLKKDSALRILLIEIMVSIKGVETKRYLSTRAYNTGPNDVPANQHYEPIVATGINLTEQLSINLQPSMSVGDIEIINFDGSRDSWLFDVWANREIKVFIGGEGWSRADFRMIFNGIVADVSPKGRDAIALKIRDRMQLLNMPLSEAVIGGTGANAGNLLPVCFGECHNVTPILIDPAMLEYAVHVSSIERIIEVRDNGIPVSFTPILERGRFRLNQSPVGQITCSIQGDNTGGYVNTLAGIVQRILTAYGPAVTRLKLSDIDAANFTSFDQAHGQPLGIYLTDRSNIISTIQALASSIGAQLLASASGLFQLYQISQPQAGQFVLHDRHIEERSLTPTFRSEVVAGIKLAFCRNYTVQSQLQTALPAEHKDLYATEYLFALATDYAVRSLYKLDSTIAQQNTCLLNKVEACIEATRQLSLWKVPRTIYEAQCTSEIMTVSLGQHITTNLSRFGLSNVGAIVVMRSVSWDTGKVKIGVLV